MKSSRNQNRNESSPSNVVTLSAPAIPSWLMESGRVREAGDFTAREYSKAAGISHAAASKRLNRETELGRLSARLGVDGGSVVKLYKEVK